MLYSLSLLISYRNTYLITLVYNMNHYAYPRNPFLRYCLKIYIYFFTVTNDKFIKSLNNFCLNMVYIKTTHLLRNLIKNLLSIYGKNQSSKSISRLSSSTKYGNSDSWVKYLVIRVKVFYHRILIASLSILFEIRNE